MKRKIDNFYRVWEAWSNLGRELSDSAKECLHKILDAVPDKCIEIDEKHPCCCSYDGGNHPEYDSNCFSQVLSVWKDDSNNIYLDTEDCEKYSIENINVDELANIVDSVKETYDENYE